MLFHHPITVVNTPIVAEKSRGFYTSYAALQHVYRKDEVVWKAASSRKVLVGFGGLHAGKSRSADNAYRGDIAVFSRPDEKPAKVFTLKRSCANGDGPSCELDGTT